MDEDATPIGPLLESRLKMVSTTTSRTTGSSERRDATWLINTGAARVHRGPQERSWDHIDPGTLNSVCDAVQADSWPLTLIGPAGVGKTCLAWLLFDGCHGKRLYREVPDLLTWLIRADQGEDTLMSSGGFWSDWRGAKVAILDEIGARERVSDFHYETVKRAIDSREGQPLILVSNLTIGQIAKVYDDRIASRMAAGTVIEIQGRDRRLEAV